jgi:hypothetical protein
MRMVPPNRRRPQDAKASKLASEKQRKGKVTKRADRSSAMVVVILTIMSTAVSLYDLYLLASFVSR